MNLADLLTSDRIRVPLGGGDLTGALDSLLATLGGTVDLNAAASAELARSLTSGEAGEVMRVNDDAVIAVCRIPEASDFTAAMGVTPAPILAEAGDEDDIGTARIVVLLVTPRRLSTLRAQVIPAIMRTMRETGRSVAFLAAAAPGDVRAMREFMELELNERLVVEDALAPVSYRVYPETPMDEVLDLIIRRDLTAVPVVGENYEVLGMITAGEALKHLLHKRRTGEGEASPGREASEEAVLARDVMSRSVLCVSEDQSLMEAANLMVNRDVELLPVVREGELIGFLNRDQTLKALRD